MPLTRKSQQRQSSASTTAWVRRSALASRDAPHLGLLVVGGRAWVCAVGRSGISSRKSEGDGATPRASMAVLDGFARTDRTQLRGPFWKRINATLGWCDAAFSASYNRLVRLPFKPSHEVMMRNDALYDRLLVLDWNISRRAQGRGSAIFFHQARERQGKLQPTEGCIALPAETMRKLAPTLRRLRRVVVL